MTRAEWAELAGVLAARRQQVNDVAVHDDTVRAIAAWLSRRSSRFDAARFLALAGIGE